MDSKLLIFMSVFLFASFVCGNPIDNQKAVAENPKAAAENQKGAAENQKAAAVNENVSAESAEDDSGSSEEIKNFDKKPEENISSEEDESDETEFMAIGARFVTIGVPDTDSESGEFGIRLVPLLDTLYSVDDKGVTGYKCYYGLVDEDGDLEACEGNSTKIDGKTVLDAENACKQIAKKFAAKCGKDGSCAACPIKDEKKGKSEEKAPEVKVEKKKE